MHPGCTDNVGADLLTASEGIDEAGKLSESDNLRLVTDGFHYSLLRCMGIKKNSTHYHLLQVYQGT